VGEKVVELEKRAAAPDLWDDPGAAKSLLSRLNAEKQTLERFTEIEKALGDLVAMRELVGETGGADFFPELVSELDKVEKKVDDFSLLTYLSGEFDRGDAIMEIKSGAGGVDAADFAEMLLRMYTRWTEDVGYDCTVADVEHFEEAGVRQATAVIEGPYAYGYLSCESGVHRLVRISPFDQTGRRHTSFVQVTVWPKVPEEIEVVIDEKDLRVDTFRAGGPGGQHVNVTDSAVRITHVPTGIVATCQAERSQHLNRTRAMTILRSRLYELEREKQRERIEELKGEKKEIAWGNQIRSYVLHPYQMVKDHRTEYETSNVEAVLGGDLEQLIAAELKRRGAERR
jgi:peptide chain release factor 2